MQSKKISSSNDVAAWCRRQFQTFSANVIMRRTISPPYSALFADHRIHLSFTPCDQPVATASRAST